MFERFTDRARRVIVLAQDNATALKHNYIGSEHILLGLIQEEEGIAGRALLSLGLTHEMVMEDVVDIIGKGNITPSGHIPYTPRCKKVFEFSLREALQLGHNYIGTESQLLGIVREGEGVAAQILVKRGGGLAVVRAAVIAILEGHKSINTVGTVQTGTWVGEAGPEKVMAKTKLVGTYTVQLWSDGTQTWELNS